MRTLHLGRAAGLALCAGAAAASCLFPSFDDLSAAAAAGAGGTVGAGGVGGVGGDGGGVGGVGGAGGSSPCELAAGMHGPAGVHIVPSGGFPAFCVDATEVSVGQYREFYEGNVFPLPASIFPVQCDWKANEKSAFRPLGHGAAPGSEDYIWGHYENKTEEDRPVFGVDWCDAAIFCGWAGKRLCGSDDADDRHIEPSGPEWRRSGEWFRACGGPNGTLFGYGTTPIEGYCNDNYGPANGSPPPFNTTDVTEPPTCVATWPDGLVYNMNGNVQEHEDNCDESGATFAEDKCFPRGGALPFQEQDMFCEFAKVDSPPTRDTKPEYTGFRCCW
jgi:formylglycine-generating enzyme required for sulfatase activity